MFKSRKAQRLAALLFMFAVAGYLVHLGDDWLVNGIPAHYLGYFLAGFGALGLLRVNIWYGGPLDPRLDPPDEDAITPDDDGLSRLVKR